MPYPSGLLLGGLPRSGAGGPDAARARGQWEALRKAFEDAGKSVSVLEPPAGAGEPASCLSRQAFPGLGPRMERVCVPAGGRRGRQQDDLPARDWLRGQGYRVEALPDATAAFEGLGDCRWHPGKRLLWGGYGFQTDPEVYSHVALAFWAPVIRLKLVNERFPRLDTCFCPLTQEAVLIYPPAFDGASLELILRLFPVVLAAEEGEAAGLMACSAAVLDSRTAFVPKGAGTCARRIRALGLEVAEVDASEFLRPGGSIFRMSLPFF